jgi:hypothetical protein
VLQEDLEVLEGVSVVMVVKLVLAGVLVVLTNDQKVL